MGKVIMSGIVPQLTAPVTGTPISELAVGSVVKLNVDGVATEFLIVHQGLPSSMYDTSCDGAWLLMKDCYEKRAWSSFNKYEESAIDTYLNGDFLNLFDSDTQELIKQVKIPYHKGYGNSGAVSSGANGLSTKIFLLGCYEVGFRWVQSSNFKQDGDKLDFFELDIGTSAANKRRAYLDDANIEWWLRTPYTTNNAFVCCVNNAGGFYFTSSGNTYGIRPAFILPSDTLISNTGEVIA